MCWWSFGFVSLGFFGLGFGFFFGGVDFFMGLWFFVSGGGVLLFLCRVMCGFFNST